jgi:hypothetical protein
MSSSKIWEFRSSLQITGSCGIEFSAEIPKAKHLTAGLTKQAFQITDHKNNRTSRFDFLGVGAGASVGKSLLGPVGISGSTSDFFSAGSHIHAGVLNYGEVEMEELNNREVLIITGSLSARQGGGLTYIFFGPVPLLPFPMAWHSLAAVAGLSLSTSYGAGLMQYYGWIKNRGN